MKSTQILFLVLFTGIVVWLLTSTPLLDRVSEGFQGHMEKSSEPIIAKGLEPAKLPTEVSANPSTPGTIPFAPYGQTASTGSFPYQDPSLLPAELKQIKKLSEDLRSFLAFEAVNIAGSADPTVQLPLTQLRADSQKLDQERSTLQKNSGLQSTLTQQDLADIEGSLSFLQRKVRLFQSSGVVSDTEGFTGSEKKTRASKADINNLQEKVYGAILVLSASGTTDPVVQSRIKNLQSMYTDLTDMLAKLDKALMTVEEIPVYKEDIDVILPSLAKPSSKLDDIFSHNSGKKLSPVEQQLSTLVGEKNAPIIFKKLISNKGMFNISMDLGYNTSDLNSKNKQNIYSKKMNLQEDGRMGESADKSTDDVPMKTDTPFDSVRSGMDDRAKKDPSGLDWKKRAQSICEQARLRGMDPLDFGCIPVGSLTSPAYSWRGHTKMVCGRLGNTMDPDLPTVCGCPPVGWKGWTLSY